MAVWLSEDERRDLEAAAARAGLTLAVWLRVTALEAVREGERK